MTRTSLILPESLYQRVIIAAKQEGVTVSRLIRDVLDKSLAKQEKKRIKHMYTVLKRNRGAGDKNITDASTTIDEVLYGKKGAWRGYDK